MANKDFEELFECLSRRNVKALIVGAHAVAYHAKPRYTKDVDVLIEPSVANAKCLLQALDDFGFGSLDLVIEDFSRPGKIVQLGYGTSGTPGKRCGAAYSSRPAASVARTPGSYARYVET